MYDSIIILGPTASGKTSVAISLALKLNTEIVNADSMYIYKGMSIGTAKPTIDEMSGITHHLIDIIHPNERFSVSDYREKASKSINDIKLKNKLPIIVGGTGFYIDSLINTYSYANADIDKNIREKYENLAQIHGNEYVYNVLKEYDLDAANKLHPNDIKRVIRAIEIYELTGTKKSSVTNENTAPILKNPLIIGLNFDRDKLYNKINNRVDLMINNGLIDEVKVLLKSYNTDLQAMKAIGYKEVIAHLNGELDLGECIDKIKQHTRNYAKRQLTYFRRNKDIIWLDSYNNSIDFIVNNIIELLDKKS